ncbi:MAG: hypothetical protein K2X93_14555 [Candidatus Obscuribacterales bacterium]|nr:hypothetical protein [Candidatus Obscuribacterales bacterium]
MKTFDVEMISMSGCQNEVFIATDEDRIQKKQNQVAVLLSLAGQRQAFFWLQAWGGKAAFPGLS